MMNRRLQTFVFKVKLRRYAVVMDACGEVAVDPLYDDEVTKQELSKALNDVAAGQNRLAGGLFTTRTRPRLNSCSSS
jgi:hypothetical protein